jgi:hypothetical protein
VGVRVNVAVAAGVLVAVGVPVTVGEAVLVTVGSSGEAVTVAESTRVGITPSVDTMVTAGLATGEGEAALSASLRMLTEIGCPSMNEPAVLPRSRTKASNQIEPASSEA